MGERGPTPLNPAAPQLATATAGAQTRGYSRAWPPVPATTGPQAPEASLAFRPPPRSSCGRVLPPLPTPPLVPPAPVPGEIRWFVPPPPPALALGSARAPPPSPPQRRARGTLLTEGHVDLLQAVAAAVPGPGRSRGARKRRRSPEPTHVCPQDPHRRLSQRPAGCTHAQGAAGHAQQPSPAQEPAAHACAVTSPQPWQLTPAPRRAELPPLSQPRPLGSRRGAPYRPGGAGTARGLTKVLVRITRFRNSEEKLTTWVGFFLNMEPSQAFFPHAALQHDQRTARVGVGLAAAGEGELRSGLPGPCCHGPRAAINVSIRMTSRTAPCSRNTPTFH